jgi:hypothetical protein
MLRLETDVESFARSPAIDPGNASSMYAEIGGNGVAAAISNLYYPPEGRSPADTLTRWGT